MDIDSEIVTWMERLTWLGFCQKALACERERERVRSLRGSIHTVAGPLHHHTIQEKSERKKEANALVSER